MKTHIKILTLFFFCAIHSLSYSQQLNFSAIPDNYLSHPELGKTNHQSSANEVDYELVHLRTSHSRTFLNKNKTKSTVQSSIPLHYKNETDFWLSIDYQLEASAEDIHFPAQSPLFSLSKENWSTTITNKNKQLVFGLGQKMIFKDAQDQTITTLFPQDVIPQIKSKNNLALPHFFNGVDLQQTFYAALVKTDFIIQQPTIFPNNFTQLIFEEEIKLPRGFTLELVALEELNTNKINVLDERGNIQFTIEAPILTDSKQIDPKQRNNSVVQFGRYETLQIDSDNHLIKLIIDAEWLTNEERQFPIIIDPIITITNNDPVNSCFYPNYEQAPLSVNIPAGETIFSSEISYDFVAIQGTNAWMSDQRSFVSGPSGQTTVFSGTGDTGGTFLYVIPNSEIANGVSSGNVEYVFHLARNWGGNGCNTNFNFVNRREVTVNYATISFGNGPVFINEYSASNRSFLDGFGRTEDWIELYNADPDNFFDLSGFHLSNDASNPTLWKINNGIIPPNSRIVVFCSKRNISSGTVQHAGFNLTQLRPDQIVLADADGIVLESYEMQVTQTNHAYGRLNDGSDDWGFFPQATPWQSNTNGYVSYTSKPIIDLEAGNYSGGVTVTISAEANEEIRYTLDGATPTLSSALYESPIAISETSVLRARTFGASNTLPSFIETNTYLINENHELPIFSFSGDSDLMNLFNGNISLRPIGHFEYFENTGEFIDENLGDFDKHGNDSWSYDQRGVDFVSRDDHGYKRRLEHQFFATSERTRFRRLMVKAAANDNFPFEEGGAHIRDSYIMTLSQLAKLDLDERSSTSIVLYVNGAYWGVYDLRERVDDNNYTDFYYGQDYKYRESDEYLQFLKTWGATEAHFGNEPAITDWQNLRNYVQANNMGNSANFNYVQSQLNINSLIDYFVFNSFIVSRDWLNYNTGWWRGSNPDGQAQTWRYILWDMEASLGHFTNYTGMPNITATASPCQVENLTAGNGHAQTLRKLITENEVVRQMYVTRYADLLNTHLSCDRIIEVLDSMVAVIAPEMPRQIARWGGNLTTWENNVQEVRDFLLTRCNHLMNDGLADCYNLTGPFATTFAVFPEAAGKIKMNSEWLPSYPFNAQVFGNIETFIFAESAPGFVFSHWEVDGAVLTPNTTADASLILSQATTITAHFQDLTIGQGDLIYYWHFNNLNTPQDVTSISADYQLIPLVNATMNYIGNGPRDIDAVNDGSDLNLHLGQTTGKAARVRNPSENRALIFDLPTNGYENIRFTYAVQRTNNGQLKNHISYSINGTDFIQTDLNETEFDIQTTFDVISIDFTSIAGVADNPNFKVQITFEGNNSTLNGNNRFDNVTLHGQPINDVSVKNNEAFEVQLFPNPFDDQITIISTEPIQEILVLDMIGKTIKTASGLNSNKVVIAMDPMTKGVYLLRIKTSKGTFSKRMVKG